MVMCKHVVFTSVINTLNVWSSLNTVVLGLTFKLLFIQVRIKKYSRDCVVSHTLEDLLQIFVHSQKIHSPCCEHSLFTDCIKFVKFSF